MSIIYISHKLDEIFKLAHRVMVLRDGVVTGQINVKDADKGKLISMMVGRNITDMYPKAGALAGDIAIRVNGLTNDFFEDVTFDAHRGEIFGIYGLLGSGHQNIGSTLFGQDRLRSGEIEISGKKVKIKSPLQALKYGIAYVPAERKVEGLVLNSSVSNNILASFYSKNTRHKLTVRKLEDKITKKWISGLKIKTPSGETRTETLSGGNQQKVVLSKCLELDPDVLILNEPTRGIDVGSKAEIYKILDDLCQRGKCVIMITSEMPELLTMSDRIMVMHDGHVTGMIDAKEASQELIIKYAIGG
jgi:ABC-type sugar transport system ATPase subunit